MAVTDTAVTRAFSGKPMRVLRNRYVSDFESAGVQRGFPLQLLEGESASERGLRDGDVDGAALPVGQCGGLVNGPLSEGEVVQELVRDAASALRRRSEERRVGDERVSTCRYRWTPYN